MGGNVEGNCVIWGRRWEARKRNRKNMEDKLSSLDWEWNSSWSSWGEFGIL